jgi:hypothetical protein
MSDDEAFETHDENSNLFLRIIEGKDLKPLGSSDVPHAFIKIKLNDRGKAKKKQKLKNHKILLGKRILVFFRVNQIKIFYHLKYLIMMLIWERI